MVNFTKHPDGILCLVGDNENSKGFIYDVITGIDKKSELFNGQLTSWPFVKPISPDKVPYIWVGDSAPISMASLEAEKKIQKAKQAEEVVACLNQAVNDDKELLRLCIKMDIVKGGDEWKQFFDSVYHQFPDAYFKNNQLCIDDKIPLNSLPAIPHVDDIIQPKWEDASVYDDYLTILQLPVPPFWFTYAFTGICEETVIPLREVVDI